MPLHIHVSFDFLQYTVIYILKSIIYVLYMQQAYNKFTWDGIPGALPKSGTRFMLKVCEGEAKVQVFSCMEGLPIQNS